jgi:hypothetical protein
MRLRGAAVLALVALVAATPAAACLLPGPAARDAVLAAVTADGDLLAQDGARAHLGGLAIPQAARGSASSLASGMPAQLAATRDRWGRAAMAGPPDLALALLAAGLAVTVPADAPASCLAPFLAAEERARRAGLGIWRDPAERPVDARRGEAVAARAGLMTLAEGKIAHVGWTRRAAYLNFGRPNEGASAELPAPVWRALERQGWTRESLRGQTVRVRGVAKAGRTGRVVVETVAALEWLD